LSTTLVLALLDNNPGLEREETNMANENTKTNDADLLKAVDEVLTEALSIYEGVASGNDVRKAGEHQGDGIYNASAVPDGRVAPKAKDAPGIGDASCEGITGGHGGSAVQGSSMMTKEDKEKEDEEKKKKDMEKSDETLKSEFEAIVAKMEARGLLNKKEKEEKKDGMKKSEASAPDFSAETSSLRKSMDDRFESLAKTIKDVADAVKKIASTPVARKGVAGYQPLRKNEGAPTLRKGEVVSKLIDLKKGGDIRVDTGLINRVETGRLMKGDDDRLRNLGILGE
jgi:hypothetical protein